MTDEVKENEFLYDISDRLSKHGIDWKSHLRLCGVKESLIANTYEDDNQEECYQVLLKYTRNIADEKEKKCFFDKLKRKLDMVVSRPYRSHQKQNHSKLAMEECTDKRLQIIACRLRSHWPIPARKLNCSPDDIEYIDKNNPTILERAFQCFYAICDKNTDLQLGDILSAIRNDVKIPESVYWNIIEDLKEDIFLSEEDKDWVDRDNQDHFYITSHGSMKLLTHSSKTEHHELEMAIENLYHAKKNNLIVTVPSRKFKKRIKLSHFISESIKFIKSNFQENDFITYPSRDVNLTNGFELYLKQNSPSALLPDYDIMKHCGFLELEDIVKDYRFLKSQSSHTMDRIGVDSKNKTIFFIKISEAESLKHLKNDIDECAWFVRKFHLLHHENLVPEIRCLLSVIVIPNESEHLIKEIHDICNHCKDFIITKGTFEKFNTELQNALHRLILEREGNEGHVDMETENDPDKLKNVLANIIGHMRICENNFHL